MKNNTKYADGYLPKIAYAIATNNVDKLNYFTKRQETRYGKLTHKDMNRVIDLVYEHVK